MRWPSNRASWVCLRFLRLCLFESAVSQCFFFSLCFCGLVRAGSLSLCWWELDELEFLTVGLAESQSLLFCPVCSVSTAFWLVLWMSVRTFGLPWEFLLLREIFPSLNAEMFVEECLLSAPLSLWFAECLYSRLPWFTMCDDLGLIGFLGALTSEPVPVWESKQNLWGEFFQTDYCKRFR